jgi:hypothetical protein
VLAHNKLRGQDLIKQIKQKERFKALNHQPVYNDKVANKLAEKYAKPIEAKAYKNQTTTTNNECITRLKLEPILKHYHQVVELQC